MAAGHTLGDFEQLVLLAIMRLGDDAYGVTIRREIDACTGRSVSLGAIYPTLDRLEDKGLIRSERDRPGPNRGGRAPRYVRIQPAGEDALKRGWDEFTAMWRGFEPGALSP